MISPLNWSVAVTEIPDGGRRETRQASAAECAALSEALELVSVSNLDVTYQIKPLAGGGYRLKGTLSADVVQSCIVSLEPVDSKVSDTFDVEFWNDIEGDDDADEEIGALDAREVEPIDNNTIAVGRIVFETFSAGLDPYPRKADAQFDWQDPALSQPEKVSPFAVLKRLKDKDGT